MPLKGPNYPTWKVQCQMALMKEGVWTIVTGDQVAPTGSGADAKMPKFLADWDKAIATIVLSLDPSILYLIGDPTDPTEVWEKLSTQFQKKTWANRLHLRKKLYSMKLEEGGSMQSHIKVLTETFNELSVIGDKIVDDDQVIILLASLPDSYNVLVTALEANENVPAMEIVTERLLNTERMMGARGHDEKAMTVQKRGPRCYSCKEFGHIKAECPKARKPQVQQSSKKRYHDKKKAHKGYNATCYSKDDDSGEDHVGLTASHALLSQDVTSEWAIDSGATSHMAHDKSEFTDLTYLSKPECVNLGDGHQASAVAVGTVVFDIQQSSGKVTKCKIRDVLYVPKLTYNLLSVAKVTRENKKVVFTSEGCKILRRDGVVLATGRKKGELYLLNKAEAPRQAANVAAGQNDSELWHRRYGHLNPQSLRKLQSEEMVTGMDGGLSSDIGVCEPCAEGKQHRVPFSKSGGKRAQKILGLVHSDVCGKMSTKSLGGAEYFVTFIDDKSRMVWVYPIKTKDQVFEKFTEWKALVENATGEKLKTLRTDNGGEYTAKVFEQYLVEHGIKHEYTVPKTPEQNGVAERMNRTIVEMARSMLCEAKLPKRFWGEAVSTAVYLRNRSPTVAVKGMTPYQCWSGEKPEVGHLRVFGCVAYAHIPKDERAKFSSKARKCVFLGYGGSVKAYRLYDMDRGKVIHSRDVIFNEQEPAMCETPQVSTQKEAVMQLKPLVSPQKEPVMQVKAPTPSEKEATPVVEEPDGPECTEGGDPATINATTIAASSSHTSKDTRPQPGEERGRRWRPDEEASPRKNHGSRHPG